MLRRTITPYTVPGHTLESIVTGSDGKLWFTEFGDDRIASMTTDGVVTESPVVPGSAPTGIARGPLETIWFLGYGSNKVSATRIA